MIDIFVQGSSKVVLILILKYWNTVFLLISTQNLNFYKIVFFKL